ncbi:hypothetical protein K461DRAFT_280817 [Myriangium duriaei CBS 260.36]|uniref:Uncharacterized protein n=1 Tax=Myriangium duriaei CBS 260.36 TaxID=1168546 RepID=A0A9P4IYH6_9PEZI|nr:hypothetical protein K461DRAFT_280817 [Myriangium duriaei CBS 260.36]
MRFRHHLLALMSAGIATAAVAAGPGAAIAGNDALVQLNRTSQALAVRAISASKPPKYCRLYEYLGGDYYYDDCGKSTRSSGFSRSCCVMINFEDGVVIEEEDRRDLIAAMREQVTKDGSSKNSKVGMWHCKFPGLFSAVTKRGFASYWDAAFSNLMRDHPGLQAGTVNFIGTGRDRIECSCKAP